MVKHTQTIHRQIADELFECVWQFGGVGNWRDKAKPAIIRKFGGWLEMNLQIQMAIVKADKLMWERENSLKFY